jgi:hypothetical protein
MEAPSAAGTALAAARTPGGVLLVSDFEGACSVIV